MKTSTWIFFVIISPCVLLNCSSRVSEPIKQEVFDPGNASAQNGEKVFMKYCQKCHPAGEAGLGPAINSNPAPQFVKRFQIRHGLGVMPGFKKDEISKQDVRDISKYLRAWKSY